MDWDDIIGFMLEFVIDLDYVRFWRFGLAFGAGEGVAGLLDLLTHGSLPSSLLYLSLGLIGAIAGLIWQLAHRG